jgi:hypothetical protein
VLKASTHDQLVGAGGHHLRHGAERDAAERDRERAGQLRLLAGRRHGAERRRAQTLSVTFTPTDAANYTGATATTTITVLKASTSITWSAAGGHHLRHGAERDAAECDAPTSGHVRLLAAGRHGVERRRGPDAVGHVHADRYGETLPARPQRPRSTS